MKKIILALATSALMFPLLVQSASFYKTGTIKRTLSGTNYGGCMIQLSTGIGSGCPSSGWVSLDCDGKKIPMALGKRNYASATVAASIKKRVSVRIDNSKKVNNYCVATRLDVLY
jgi:hypothetical protein